MLTCSELWSDCVMTSISWIKFTSIYQSTSSLQTWMWHKIIQKMLLWVIIFDCFCCMPKSNLGGSLVFFHIIVCNSFFYVFSLEHLLSYETVNNDIKKTHQIFLKISNFNMSSWWSSLVIGLVIVSVKLSFLIYITEILTF